MTCEWEGCRETATHDVTVALPDGAVTVWNVCSEHDKAAKVTTTRSRDLRLEPRALGDDAVGIVVRCGGCTLPLDESPSQPAADRQPCPVCGSTQRASEVFIHAELRPRGELVANQKRPGVRGTLRRIKTGSSYTLDTQTWATRTLDIDREHNTYREEIVLSDGTRIESTGPLDEHRGHGGR